MKLGEHELEIRRARQMKLRHFDCRMGGGQAPVNTRGVGGHISAANPLISWPPARTRNRVVSVPTRLDPMRVKPGGRVHRVQRGRHIAAFVAEKILPSRNSLVELLTK